MTLSLPLKQVPLSCGEASYGHSIFLLKRCRSWSQWTNHTRCQRISVQAKREEGVNSAASVDLKQKAAKDPSSLEVQRALAARLRAAQDPFFFTIDSMREQETKSRAELNAAQTEALKSSSASDTMLESGTSSEEAMEGSWDLDGRSVVQEVFVRGQWLLGLLVLQSTSSFVLEANQQLIKDHLVITLFLTMLVGAGGNAGNQSAILVIRGLATRELQADRESLQQVLSQQLLVGLSLGAALAFGGFARVLLTSSSGSLEDATAIAVSLFLIVLISVLTGSALPFVLAWSGKDPANAGTTVQVVMDILGVAISCTACYLILERFASIFPSDIAVAAGSSV